jgi:hypothetical protein
MQRGKAEYGERTSNGGYRAGSNSAEYGLLIDIL